MNTATIEKNASKQSAKKQTETIIATSRETYIAAMNDSLVTRKYSINVEMSICLSVYLENGNVNRDSQKSLREIYAESGWNCLSENTPSYKTVQRRIGVAAILFTHFGKDVLSKVVEGKMGMMRISSLVEFIAKEGFDSIDSIRAFTGNPRPKASSAPTENRDTPRSQEPNESEKKRVLSTKDFQGLNQNFQDMRSNLPEADHRVSDDIGAIVAEMSDEEKYQQFLILRSETPLLNLMESEKGYTNISEEHFTISLPPETSAQEIRAAAFELLRIADAMARENVETLEFLVAGAVHGNVPAEPEKTDAELDKAAIIKASSNEAEPMKTKASRFRKPAKVAVKH